jgi:hypothetical protein
VIYEHEEPWRNDIDRETDLSTRILWQFYQQNHLAAKQEELTKEVINFTLLNIVFILIKVL